MHHFNPIASFGRTAVVATSLLSMASAHLFIAEPKPIQGNAIKDPLDPSGSNFPCHGAPLPTSGGQKMVAGETFPLQFEMAEGANTAVHGGGSCQLAILSDTANAADPASWNVIYSIEGGCPSNTQGNLAPGFKACTSADQGDCMHSWDIPMPKGVKSGNAILSWTWFNTIGNREMYQNCVNVDITGGSGDGTFPPLFVANLASVNDVKTTENSDVLPGTWRVRHHHERHERLQPPQGHCGQRRQPQGSWWLHCPQGDLCSGILRPCFRSCLLCSCFVCSRIQRADSDRLSDPVVRQPEAEADLHNLRHCHIRRRCTFNRRSFERGSGTYRLLFWLFRRW